MRPLYVAAKEHPASDAPSFLAAKEAANERVVRKPGELSPEQYAEKVAREPTTMTFLAEPFERFKRGETVFDCRLQCSLAYERRKGDWKRLHARAQWRDLAVSVLQVGYQNDLSYFLLGEAARGLGLPQPAQKYYRRALDAGGDFGCGEDCAGFEVRKLAQSRLGA